MAKRDNLKSSISIIVDLPADKFDLADWIIHFPNEEYIACTPATGAHKQMYVYRDADGGRVFRNDESCGGFMMTQLYREEIMEPNHVFLVSPRTKGRFLGFVPMTFQITWDIKVEPLDERRSTFTCTVGARMNPLYLFAGWFIRLSYWTEAHLEEETPRFADSAARWATRNDPNQRPSYVSPTIPFAAGSGSNPREEKHLETRAMETVG
jgi:hypothetical protein